MTENPNTHLSWDTSWVPRRSFRLNVGALPDLSVDQATEMELRRLRWRGIVLAGLPNWFEPQDEPGLVSFVDAHLVGRHPRTFVNDNRVVSAFSVSENSPAVREAVANFAANFATDKVFGRAALAGMTYDVRFHDTSAVDQFLPEYLRPRT